MQNEMNPQLQTLLDELAKDSYFVPSETKALAKLLEPDFDIAIPLLIEKLKDQSKNHDSRDNALKVLAVSTDPRSILPVLRYIEIETGWRNTVFDYIRQGLSEKGDDARQKVNEQLIRYLEEGPKIPAPGPFDPVATENSFNDFLKSENIPGMGRLDVDFVRSFLHFPKLSWDIYDD